MAWILYIAGVAFLALASLLKSGIVEAIVVLGMACLVASVFILMKRLPL